MLEYTLGRSIKMKSKETAKIFSQDFDKDKPTEERLISPWQAREFVEDKGVSEDTWDDIMAHSKYSHEIRGLIFIARQDSARTLSDVYREQYPDGNHNSLGDLQAKEAADSIPDSQWQEFANDHY
jgi:hypothetical protein